MEPADPQTNDTSISEPVEAPLPPPLTHRRSVIDWIRGFWKIVMFLVVTVLLGPAMVYTIAAKLFGDQATLHSPLFLLALEAGEFAILAGYTGMMALLEHRPFGDYGLPLRDAFKTNYGVGFLLGLAEGSVLIGCILVLGGYSFGSWALTGPAVLGWGLLHLVLFILVGLYEEFVFRGYAQFSLSKLIGFWPAALVLSAGFGLVHLKNPGEGWVGAASITVVGLLFAFTLKRSGNLWYAVGLHAGFDWAESFLYSVPDSGVVLNGHLSNAVLRGPNWLTGGSIGPEGSVFCFITLGLQFLVVNWLFPAKRPESTADVRIDPS